MCLCVCINVFLFWFSPSISLSLSLSFHSFYIVYGLCYICWFIVIIINPVAKLDIHNHQIKHVYGDFTTGSGDFWYKITEFGMQCKCLLLSFAVKCCYYCYCSYHTVGCWQRPTAQKLSLSPRLLYIRTCMCVCVFFLTFSSSHTPEFFSSWIERKCYRLTFTFTLIIIIHERRYVNVAFSSIIMRWCSIMNALM